MKKRKGKGGKERTGKVKESEKRKSRGKIDKAK